MKKLLVLPLLWTCITLHGQGNSQELLDRGLLKFPIERGKVEYVITGNATGKATLYFDRYGWRSVLITEMTMKQFGVESAESSKELWDGDFWFKADLKTNKGAKKQDDRWSQLVRYKEPAAVPGILFTNDGGVNAGTELLLEKETIRWLFPKGIVQSLNEWGGITLRTTKKLPGLVYEITAITLSENQEIDPKVFELPESVVWD